MTRAAATPVVTKKIAQTRARLRASGGSTGVVPGVGTRREYPAERLKTNVS